MKPQLVGFPPVRVCVYFDGVKEKAYVVAQSCRTNTHFHEDPVFG